MQFVRELFLRSPVLWIIVAILVVAALGFIATNIIIGRRRRGTPLDRLHREWDKKDRKAGLSTSSPSD